VTLTACHPGESMHGQDLEIKVDEDGSLLVAVCSEFGATRGSADLRKAEGGGWERFWETEQDVDLEAGEIGRFGSEPFGLRATLDRVPQLSSGDQVAVQLVQRDSDLDLYVIFTIDDLEAVRGMWLNADGELATDACSS
jgi:hypothetical protein